jgi:hypothetical protein
MHPFLRILSFSIKGRLHFGVSLLFRAGYAGFFTRRLNLRRGHQKPKGTVFKVKKQRRPNGHHRPGGETRSTRRTRGPQTRAIAAGPAHIHDPRVFSGTLNKIEEDHHRRHEKPAPKSKGKGTRIHRFLLWILEFTPDGLHPPAVHAQVPVTHPGSGTQLDDLPVSINKELPVVHESQESAELHMEILGSLADNGCSCHALDHLFQTVHGLGGSGIEKDRIDLVLPVFALAGNAVGGRGAGRKPVVFHPQVGRARPATPDEKEDEQN